jgi:hypothetical protein
MTQLDEVTQSNASSAQRTATASVQLSSQSDTMQSLVSTLLASVHGAGAVANHVAHASTGPQVSAANTSHSSEAGKVVSLNPRPRVANGGGWHTPRKLAAGAENMPSSDDSRFEDV